MVPQTVLSRTVSRFFGGGGGAGGAVGRGASPLRGAGRPRPGAWLAVGLALAVVAAGSAYARGTVGGRPLPLPLPLFRDLSGDALPANSRDESRLLGDQRGLQTQASNDVAGPTGQGQLGAKAAPETAARSASAPAQGATSGASASGAVTLPPLPPTADRLIVKSGSISLQVADLAEGMRRVGEIVAAVPGAYVGASSTTYRGGVVAPGAEAIPPVSPAPPRPTPAPGQSATLLIRVPAADFGPTLERLRSLGTPLQEQVSTQEVTEEYVDLEAQVRNLETLEQQYLRLLERAQRVEEIIPLQQRAVEVRTQIDRLRGRLNLLQRRADLSTISVSLLLPSRAGEPGAVAEPRPVRTLRLAVGQLALFLQALLDLAIYIGVLLIPFVPLALGVYWWRRGRRPAPPASQVAPSA